MELSERVARLIEPALVDMGFDLVRVLVQGNRRATLQIMAEPSDGRSMTVDDCAEISRAVSAILDVEDPIAGAYTLEVSSPGLDRPLVRRRDFERYAGFEAKAEMDEPVDGRKRFVGTLIGVAGDEVLFDVEGVRVALPFAGIRRAKLVLTDALLAAAAREQDETETT